jgi:two-component system, OmpR family, sensor kinase
MPGTASPPLARWADALWVAFAAAGFAAMVEWHAWETVPFHLVWISLIVLYGFRLWPPLQTGLVLAAVCAASTAVLLHQVSAHGGSAFELAEVPLMAGVFVAMAWHARRRADAMDDVRRAAARERDFVRDASHLLRTPITVARGHAELLVAGTDGQERRDGEVVVGELERLSRIAGHLLVLASSEAPRPAGLAPVDVGALLRGTVRRWAGAADRDWRCEVAVDGVLPGDEERLVLALDALVENAVRATGAGDRIAVRGRADGATAVLEVADAGTGIAPDLLPRVFERFASGANGTGLGLAIVRAVAEAHGGSVDLVSAPGEGTTARLRLPGLLPAPADERAVTFT